MASVAVILHISMQVFCKSVSGCLPDVSHNFSSIKRMRLGDMSNMKLMIEIDGSTDQCWTTGRVIN